MITLAVVPPTRRSLQRAAYLRQAAGQAAEGLRQRWPHIEIKLFGSVSRGQAHARSDIDLVVTGLAAHEATLAWVVASDAAETEDLDLIRWEECPEHLRLAISHDAVLI